MRDHQYYVYIVTNKNKTVLYIGVTNDLRRRLAEHKQSAEVWRPSSFTGKYNAYYLVYYECFGEVHMAIAREKELKGWIRSKKDALINSVNPSWRFLNDTI